MIKLTLPYPPSVNRIWRRGKSHRGKSHTYKATHVTLWEQQVVLIAKAAKVPMLAGPLKIVLKLFRPQKSGDGDNRLKSVCDALQGVAYENDSWFVDYRILRYDDRLNPRAEVKIEKSPAVPLE